MNTKLQPLDQNPETLTPNARQVLELSSVVLCHKFHSRDWYEALRKKIPLPDTGFEVTQRLAPGEALVFASSFGQDQHRTGDPPPRVMRVQMRERLTADGGASRTPAYVKR